MDLSRGQLADAGRRNAAIFKGLDLVIMIDATGSMVIPLVPEMLS